MFEAVSSSSTTTTTTIPDAISICNNDAFLDALIASLRRLSPNDTTPIYDFGNRSIVDISLSITQEAGAAATPTAAAAAALNPIEVLRRLTGKLNNTPRLDVRCSFNVGSQHLAAPSQDPTTITTFARSLIACRNRINSNLQLAMLKLHET